jgi:4-hydroxy-2-oxoheptanedioate aldolase
MINQVNSKLGRGEIVIGSFLYIPSAALTEIIGLIGFDFVVIDMEHGPIETETAEQMVRAAELSGLTPLIRITLNAPHLILRALDIGASGVHVPNVNNVKLAEAMVASVKYAPQGSRGLAGVRAAKYGLKEPLSTYTIESNRESLVIAQIESVEGIHNLDDILRVEGIDVYYLGPVDLSNSLGIPGQTKDSRVVNNVENAIKQIVAAGKTAGCIAADVNEAKRYIDLGARYIATHAVRFMVNGSKEFLEGVRR